MNLVATAYASLEDRHEHLLKMRENTYHSVPAPLIWWRRDASFNKVIMCIECQVDVSKIYIMKPTRKHFMPMTVNLLFSSQLSVTTNQKKKNCTSLFCTPKNYKKMKGKQILERKN